MVHVHDSEGREWLAEKIGRTSGILSPTDKPDALLAPHDIIRFSCTDVAGGLVRETTLTVGTLENLSEEELLDVLSQARTV